MVYIPWLANPLHPDPCEAAFINFILYLYGDQKVDFNNYISVYW